MASFLCARASFSSFVCCFSFSWASVRSRWMSSFSARARRSAFSSSLTLMSPPPTEWPPCELDRGWCCSSSSCSSAFFFRKVFTSSCSLRTSPSVVELLRSTTSPPPPELGSPLLRSLAILWHMSCFSRSRAWIFLRQTRWLSSTAVSSPWASRLPRVYVKPTKGRCSPENTALALGGPDSGCLRSASSTSKLEVSVGLLTSGM
uniref:Uncharacterized protein n=1 Tax=Ixodes ricinus TaxID=34613 RepID=A0A6B0V2M6_IXORI